MPPSPAADAALPPPPGGLVMVRLCLTHGEYGTPLCMTANSSVHDCQGAHLPPHQDLALTLAPPHLLTPRPPLYLDSSITPRASRLAPHASRLTPRASRLASDSVAEASRRGRGGARTTARTRGDGRTRTATGVRIMSTTESALLGAARCSTQHGCTYHGCTYHGSTYHSHRK